MPKFPVCLYFILWFYIYLQTYVYVLRFVLHFGIIFILCLFYYLLMVNKDCHL